MQMMIWKKLHSVKQTPRPAQLTTSQVDAVKEIGCSSTIGQTLKPKKKQTRSKSSLFGESLDDSDKAGINKMLWRETVKRDTKQAQQMMTEDPQYMSLMRSIYV